MGPPHHHDQHPESSRIPEYPEFSIHSLDIVVRMRRENASGCGRRHTGDRGDLADRSTRKELTLFSVSFISFWCFALLLFRPLVMHESYIVRDPVLLRDEKILRFTLRTRGGQSCHTPMSAKKKRKVCFPYRPAGRGRGYGDTAWALVIHDGLLLSRMAVTTD